MPTDIEIYPQLGGKYTLRGSYEATYSTTATTTVAARTTTAGHLLGWRWPGSSNDRCVLRYVGARAVMTTAFGTAQEVGVDMIVARGYTASHTGGAQIDTGSTLTGSGKKLTAFGTSRLGVASTISVGTTGALTAGTHTLDASPISTITGWATTTLGDLIPSAAAQDEYGMGCLYDVRDYAINSSRRPLVFAANEGFVIRNLILMGATGVCRWDFRVSWDEITPA